MLSLREILDRIEFESLLMEGRDPVEVLHYKFKDIPSNVIDAVIQVDPTKKKSYSQWLLSKWPDEKNVIVKALRDGRLKKLFDYYKTHDGVQIKDCPSVTDGLRDFVPATDSVLTKSDKPMTYVKNLDQEVASDLANDFDIVYDDDRWLIAVPNTYEAECKLGENMKWCTANAFGNGESYYDRYLSDGGKYYVNFDKTRGESRNGKEYPYTRYQFHFETKQFKDKNDDDVDLSEIDMPEGAMKFYESEGYDASDFENLETRMERYDQWRYQHTYYSLNDELSLNIAYDDDYETVEVNESTDFYIFDDNDDRDPISWEEVPNPFTNDDVVRLNKEDYLVLRSKFDEDTFIAVINETQNNRQYRTWEAYRIYKWIELPQEVGLFCEVREDNVGHYSILTAHGKESYNKLDADFCENMFINKPCTDADAEKWGRIFIETVTGKYHNLFAVDIDSTMGHSLECIIKNDIPKNGTQYVIENGVIQGAYGRYNAYDDGNDSGDEFTKYALEDELENGDYIISHSFAEEGEEKTVENVLKKGSKEPLLPMWVDEIFGFDCDLYITKKDKLIGFFSQTGEHVGDWYNVYGALDKTLSVMVGKAMGDGHSLKVDFISGKEGNVFASFNDIFTNYQADHNILVIPFANEGETSEPISYNYETREYSHPEFETYRKINQYNNKIFLCKLRGSNDNVIYNFKEQRVIIDGIVGVEGIRHSDFTKLIKQDGKINLFDTATLMQILPYDVDSVNEVAEYKNEVVFVLNGRSYIYNYKDKRYVSDPKGLDLEIFIDSYGYYVFSDGEYSVRFYLGQNGEEFKGWYNKFKSSGEFGYTLDGNVPQQVMNIYNKVTGQQVQPQEVTESFKRLMLRMNDVSRLLHENRLVR